jgi:tetratricopeptide (TPR) repeat protein
MSPPKPSAPTDRTLLATLVVTVVMIAAAALVPAAREGRLWGINHLAFYSVPVRLAAVILMALAFVPGIARPAYDALVRVPGALRDAGGRSNLIIALVALGSVFLFYQLRAATTLLGDGQLLLKSFEVGHAGTNDKVLMRSVGSIVTSDLISPGTTLLYYGVMKLVAGPIGRPVADALAMVPSLLGGIYVFFVLRFVRDLPASNTIRAWLLVLGIFTAGLQLFFGYIENYSLILLLLALYVAAALRVLHGRGAIWVPAVLLLAAAYAHVQSLVFLPSLIYLVAWRRSGCNDRVAGNLFVPVLLILTVAGALVARALEIPGDFYLPWTANEDTYGIVSPGHLLDMLNEAFMLVPVLPFVVVAWWVGRRAPAGDTSDGWFNTPREWQFVAMMLVTCLVYMTFFKPEIGMARDWDLFSMSVVALVPLVLLAVNRYLTRTAPGRNAAAVITVPALVVTVVMAVSWIGINASADRTTDRYEAILDYDTTHVGYAYENLATFYYDRNDLPRAIRAQEKGATISGNPRIYAKLAGYYELYGDIESGIEVLRGAVERYPRHQKARKKLLDLLEKGQRWEEMERVSRGGHEFYPREPIYAFALGVALVRQGKTEAGVEALRDCLELNPPEAMRKHVQGFITNYEQRLKSGGK